MKVSKEIETFIVEQAARYEDARDIQKAIKTIYGAQYALSTVRGHISRARKRIQARREEINRELQEVPIANLFYRLQERQRMLEHLKAQKYTGLDGKTSLVQQANQLLDSVAREIQVLTQQGWEGTIKGLLEMSEEDFKRFIQDSELPDTNPGALYNNDAHARRETPSQAAVLTLASARERVAPPPDPPDARVPCPKSHPSPPISRECLEEDLISAKSRKKKLKDFTLDPDAVDFLGYSDILKESEKWIEDFAKKNSDD